LGKEDGQSCAFEIWDGCHADASGCTAAFLNGDQDECRFPTLKLAASPQTGLGAPNPGLVDFHFAP
jgi:hypothetical protein